MPKLLSTLRLPTHLNRNRFSATEVTSFILRQRLGWAGIVCRIQVLDPQRPHVLKMPYEVLHSWLQIFVSAGRRGIRVRRVKRIAHSDVERAGDQREIPSAMGRIGTGHWGRVLELSVGELVPALQ